MENKIAYEYTESAIHWFSILVKNMDTGGRLWALGELFNFMVPHFHHL